MEHDFHDLCEKQLEKLDKRMTSLAKAFKEDYETAMGVINNKHANEHRDEMMQTICDRLYDEQSMTLAKWRIALDSVQGTMKRYLV